MSRVHSILSMEFQPLRTNGCFLICFEKNGDSRGLLVTDYNSIAEMSSHGIAPLKEASVRSLQAGTDMDMVSFGFLNTLEESLQSGEVTEEQINTACRRVLEVKYKLGLFDNPYKYCDTLRASKQLYTTEHRSIARSIASETFVYLKMMKSLLPISC